MTCLAIACFALIAGQGAPPDCIFGLMISLRQSLLDYATPYLARCGNLGLLLDSKLVSLSTCHAQAETAAVQLLAQISFFILGSKVRSRALLFLYKLFFQLVYHVFYRNLVSSLPTSDGHVADEQFARLRTPSQFAVVQILSSISVFIIFPLQMTKLWHRTLQIVIGYPSPWEEHAESVAIGFYCRSLAQNVTMVGFLGEVFPWSRTY